jgi:tetratricopeptide (TPR) repeat protein
VYRLAQAVAVADRAVQLGPQEALTCDTLGVVYSRANEHARAAQLFARASALEPRKASYHFNRAASLRFLGDFDAAEKAYEACIALEPHHWRAHSALSEIRRQTPERNHIQRLTGLLAETGGDADAALHLHMALAKECEDLGDHDGAFRHLQQGKSGKRRALRYAFAEDAAIFDTLRRLFAEPIAAGGGFPTREPIFVVGMPRSGTTLVERILTSHSQVFSAGELQNFGLALKRLAGTRAPRLLDVETLERGSRVDPRALGEVYLASTRPATGRKPHFVDKMPLNFLYAGFIAHALPQARIVCLRRNALDTCLSNFRQLFSVEYSYYNYAYDLLDTGRYFIEFHRLMAHWQRVLPGRVLEVSYEALVENQEAETRRLLEHCGLPWEDACLAFEQNAAPVATASAVQVRAPMYRFAVGRWRLYAPHLAELQALLASAGV